MAKNEGARQTGEAYVANILPDWCYVGPAKTLIPFNIVAKLDLSLKLAKNVVFKDQKAFTMESRVIRCEGDTGEGIFSGCSRGFCRPITFATKVKATKQFVIHDTSHFHMNSASPEGTPNTIGKLIYVKIGEGEVTEQISEADIADAKKEMNEELKKSNRGWWDHKNVSPEFEKKVGELATELGVKPNDLMSVFSVETVGTFSPSIANPINGATGLIQFTGTTAASMLGYPATAAGKADALTELRGMTNTEQLDVVRNYLLPYKDQISGNGVDELYMTVFTGRPRTAMAGSDVLYRQGSSAYSGNAQYDLNGDGTITKDEALSKVRKQVAQQDAKEAKNAKIKEGIKVTGGF